MSRKKEDEYEHNEILSMMATLGKAAGFSCYVGKKEQGGSGKNEKFSETSIKSLPFLRGAEKFTKSKVEQIDLIWLDAKRPVFAFEIEHSTPITTGLDRFLELLKLDNTMAEKIIIVAPAIRQNKMNQVFGSSHYIGAPMYLETKVRYLWYSEFLDIFDRFSKEQPTKAILAEAIAHALHLPKAKIR